MARQTKGIAIAVVAFAGLIGLSIFIGRIILLAGGAHELKYPAVTDTHPDPTVFATVVGKPTAGVDLKQMFVVTPAVIAHGKQLFDVNCAMCHGAAGKGDGAAAVALTPKPRDFTKSDGWTVGYTLADIYQTVSEGVKGTGMPAFDALTPPDRFAVAHYVQSLGHFDHHDNAAAEIPQIDARYHLSEGPLGPNKVAVPTVMRHMVAEYRAPPAIAMPPASDRSTAAELRRALVADPVRAAAVLAQTGDWRSNAGEFAQVAMAGAPDNGFRPAVADLDAAQWTAFHAELVKLTPEADSGSLGFGTRSSAGQDPRAVPAPSAAGGSLAGGGSMNASTKIRRVAAVAGVAVGVRAAPPAKAPAVSRAGDPAITEQMVGAGRTVYHGAGGCFACHGMNMEGTAMAPALDKKGKPWLAAKGGSYAEILRVIEKGVPATAMLARPNGISDDAAKEVAAYVWAVNNGKTKP